MTRQDVLDQAKSLTKEDQITLTLDLCEMLSVQSAENELTASQIHELERRVELYEADPSRGVPWEVVRAQLLRGRD